MIGVIKVKCMGSVRAGERIYATVDLDNPGTAIPESHLPPSVIMGRNNILLGMSMEEKKASTLDDVNMVQCFVCIVLGVNDKEITSEIENMYDQFEMDLAVKLRRERKKFRRSKRFFIDWFQLFGVAEFVELLKLPENSCLVPRPLYFVAVEPFRVTWSERPFVSDTSPKRELFTIEKVR